MGIQINGQNDEIRAVDGSGTVHLDIVGNVTGNVTGDLSGNVTGDLSGNVTGNLTGTASTATAAATAYGLSGSPTLTGITSVSTTNLTVNGNAYPNAGPLSNRNLIINGAMTVAQRNTQVTGANSSYYYTCDRVYFTLQNLGTWTVDQSTDAPNGFSNSFKVTCTTADASPSANDVAMLDYNIEAQDLQHLDYGASTAKVLTFSFWVKSNKTGTASIEINQPDNTYKQYITSYSISSADTWEYKTISIPADTAGVINNDNGSGLRLRWWLNSGSTYQGGTPSTTWATWSVSNSNVANLGVGGATSDYFAITGVQLEVGSVATPFEHRSYGDELERCQRYYYKDLIRYGRIGQVRTSGLMVVAFDLPVSMRQSNSVSLSTYNYWAYYDGSSPTVSGLNSGSGGGSTAFVILSITANATIGATVFWYSGLGDLIIDSEL